MQRPNFGSILLVIILACSFHEPNEMRFYYLETMRLWSLHIVWLGLYREWFLFVEHELWYSYGLDIIQLAFWNANECSQQYYEGWKSSIKLKCDFRSPNIRNIPTSSKFDCKLSNQHSSFAAFYGKDRISRSKLCKVLLQGNKNESWNSKREK